MANWRKLTGPLAIAASIFLTAEMAIVGTAVAQQTPSKIRIGYAVSLTGPFAGPSSTLNVANYRLWTKETNAKGGILIKSQNRRVPIEVVEYDDTSNPETAIRLTERLMLDDKVDFVMPPWGTGMNLAVAPVYKKNNYPLLGATSVTNNADAIVKRFDTMFFLAADSPEYAKGLVEVLRHLKADGKINNKVAVLSVADQFGADLNAAASVAFKNDGFDTVVSKSYPMASRDISNEMKQAQESGADTFVAFSYPPDTFLINSQAQSQGYNPKVFFSAAGTATPAFHTRFGAKAEGVLGAGGWDRTSPGAEVYFKAYKDLIGSEPDRWGSPVIYASLQILEQAIENVGIDRTKVIEAIRTQTFETVVGSFKFSGQVRRSAQPLVSQWQNGDFVTIEPRDLPGSKPIVFPKPQ